MDDTVTIKVSLKDLCEVSRIMGKLDALSYVGHSTTKEQFEIVIDDIQANYEYIIYKPLLKHFFKEDEE